MSQEKQQASASTDSQVMRILDANQNRATEGLRVAEEYTRFVLEDAFLSRQLKELRHQLAEAAREHISGRAPLSFRDVSHDVGTSISTNAEFRRGFPIEVAQASFKRTQQAIRNLEEYGKIISPTFAGACESARYRSYALEQAVIGTRDVNSRIAAARVYVLIDGKQNVATFEREAEEIASVADVIQLRDKKLADAALLDRAKRLRTVTRKTACLFIMNDRPDIANLSAADGVHLGQDELGVREARQILGEKAVIGISTHTLEQVHQAVLDGANYLGCGPVFSSTTKAFDAFPGPDFLRRVSKETTLPSFAIGGIGLENLAQVIEAGFRRIAIQGSVNHATLSAREIILAMKAKLAPPV